MSIFVDNSVVSLKDYTPISVELGINNIDSCGRCNHGMYGCDFEYCDVCCSDRYLRDGEENPSGEVCHTCSLSNFKKEFKILVVSAVGSPITSPPNNTKFCVQIYSGSGTTDEISRLHKTLNDVSEFKLEYQGTVDKSMDSETFPRIVNDFYKYIKDVKSKYRYYNTSCKASNFKGIKPVENYIREFSIVVDKINTTKIPNNDVECAHVSKKKKLTKKDIKELNTSKKIVKK